MHRTLKNLEVINALHLHGHVEGKREVYEVTQLVNSFLSAWAHPWEEWERDLRCISLEEAREAGWPIKRPDDDRDEAPRNLGDWLKWIRNAMAHGNIRFLRDPSNPEDIGGVRLWNQRGRWRTWGITLNIAELQQCLKCFVDLAEQMPEPRDRSVLHIKDRPVQAVTSTTVSIPEDLTSALAAYGHDRDLGHGLDPVVETALRDLLGERGYLLPFRPLRITPLHRDEGPTDVSLNHDRYFAAGETSGPR